MRLPDRIWVPAAAALLLAVAFTAALLLRAEGDASLLVRAAPPWTDEASAPSSLTVQAADRGFDGQFFYRNAARPLSDADREVGVEHDLPALRHSRIGYSALAWLASGGQVDAVPWALLGVNVAAAAAIGAAGGVLARQMGRHAAWGVALALWPGFAYSLSLDTAELVAAAAGLGGLAAVGGRRWLAAVGLLALAALTRETALVYAFGVGVVGLVHLRRGPRRLAPPFLATALATLGAFVAWHVFVLLRFGELALGSSGGSNNTGAPLMGVLTEIGRSFPPGGGEELYRLACIGGLVVLGVLAATGWRTTTAPLEVRVAWIPAAAVVVLLNDYQWSGATAFLRASTEAGLLATLIVLGSSDLRVRALAAGGLAGGWLLSAAAQLSKVT